MARDKKDNGSQYDEMHLENSVYLTEVPDSYKNRKPYKPINIKHLTAAIPGTIVDIYIEEGEKVEANKELLILEAMKMRNKVRSSIEGEIKTIHVKSGDIVRKGTLLIEYK